jgi:IS6 family transposase
VAGSSLHKKAGYISADQPVIPTIALADQRRTIHFGSPSKHKLCTGADKSYRIDETYIKLKGEDKYLYRVVDSTGQTIDFLLTAKRDTAAAKCFCAVRLTHRRWNASGDERGQHPAYPAAVDALKADGVIPRRVVLRRCKYLNNVIEQDHRTVKKRVRLAKGYGSFQSDWRTLQGIKTVHMIRKSRVRWLAKGNAIGQPHFIAGLFGLIA